MGMNIAERIRLLAAELFSRRALVTGTFLLVSLAVTAVGLAWPKSFTSYATVQVAGNSLISGLVEGRAAEQSSDWGAVAQEILYGRRVLTRIAERGGWTPQSMEPEQADYLLDKLRDSSEISLVGESLIRIEYSDSDPRRAQAVAQAFADLLIQEVVQAQASDSAETVAFIDAQAKKYESRLRELEQAVEQFQERHRLSGTASEERMAERVARLTEQYHRIEAELEEARVRKSSIEQQLADGAGSANLMSSVEESYRAQLSELRERLAELRVRYRDSYPDVQATMDQIAQVEQRLRAVRSGSPAARELAAEALRASPVYESLREQIREAEIQVQTLTSRLTALDEQLSGARSDQQEAGRSSNRLAQLTRDYEVTRELHQDLLRRREAARVSASLDEAGSASGLSVEEPAFLPHQAEGPRLLMFMGGAVGLGLLLPVGMIFTLQQFDPRIRRSDQILRFSELPVLAAIPRYRRPAEERAQVRGVVASVLLIIVGLAAVVIAGIARLQGVI